jgi:NADH-quinone oxidoreductase subunit N
MNTGLGIILPQIILAASILLIVIIIMIRRNHLATCVVNLTMLTAAAVCVFFVQGRSGNTDSLFSADGLGIYMLLVIILSSIIVTILSYRYLEERKINKEEYYILLLSGTLGATSLAAANNFITFFLGLELLSLSIYVLSAYMKVWESGTEAAVKYFIMTAVSSAFLLLGMAFLFASTGSMDFAEAGNRIASSGFNPFVLAGIGLIFAGSGFKMAVVPFHMWAPDVYQGSPSPVAAFIATVSKGAILAVFLRFYAGIEGTGSGFTIVLTVISVLSMLVGNIMALTQNNVKRILGYSSIAHFGYILICLIAGTKLGAEAAAFYILAYAVSIAGAFGVITLMSDEGHEAGDMNDFRGMFWSHPFKAAIMTGMLLSLAGIPLTAGFTGKFFILSAGISEGFFLPAIVLIISSAAGLYYYLRVIVEMFREAEEGAEVKINRRFQVGGMLVLAFLFVMVLYLGILPGAVTSVIEKIITVFN